MRKQNSNSTEVYRNGVEPTKQTRKQRIIEVLSRLRKATMKEIAQEMGVPVHTISGRFGEMQSDNLIRVSGTRDFNVISYGKEFTKQENEFELIS